MNKRGRLHRSPESDRENSPFLNSRERRIENNNEEIFSINSYDNRINDASPCPPIFEMSEDERKYMIANHPNPYGYPETYIQIMNREKSLRITEGCDPYINCVFLGNGREIASQGRINTLLSQHRNINCIRSKQMEHFDCNFFHFCGLYRELIRKQGYKTYPFSEYSIEKDYINDINKTVNEMREDGLYENHNYDNELNDEEYPNNSEDYLYNYDIIRRFPNYEEENKLEEIIFLLNVWLGEYAKYVVIAGGFALSYFTYNRFGYYTKFNDIDLFIHSCDERTANIICHKLSEFTQTKTIEIENVVLSIPSIDLIYQDIKNQITFQIIKRLYRCPSEIIHGFDVDCCCILVDINNTNIYATERCLNAIQNCYNVVNFSRLSPSYNDRLAKYNKRGFGIWIPHIDYFKKNFLCDINYVDRRCIVYNILKEPKRQICDYHSPHINFEMNIEEAMENGKLDSYTPEFIMTLRRNHHDIYKKYGIIERTLTDDIYIKFKVLNPGEQIINTFNREIYEDPIKWYPKIDFPVNHIEITNSDEIIQLDENNKTKFVYGSNLIRNYRIPHGNIITRRKKEVCKLISNEISNNYPEVLQMGHIVSESILNCTLKPYKRRDDHTNYENCDMYLNDIFAYDEAIMKFEYDKFLSMTKLHFHNTYFDTDDTNDHSQYFLDKDFLENCCTVILNEDRLIDLCYEAIRLGANNDLDIYNYIHAKYSPIDDMEEFTKLCNVKLNEDGVKSTNVEQREIFIIHSLSKQINRGGGLNIENILAENPIFLLINPKIYHILSNDILSKLNKDLIDKSKNESHVLQTRDKKIWVKKRQEDIMSSLDNDSYELKYITQNIASKHFLNNQKYHMYSPYIYSYFIFNVTFEKMVEQFDIWNCTGALKVFKYRDKYFGRMDEYQKSILGVQKLTDILTFDPRENYFIL